MQELRHFWKRQSGAAAVELALILPLLLVIMFGGFEAATYFWTEHKVIKAVRDGARFAARQPFSAYEDCKSPSGALLSNIQNLTRTGELSGGTTKVAGWINDDVSVEVACVTPVPGTYSGEGLYKDQPDGALHVTVSATVAYPPFFGTLGFVTTDVIVKASARAAVMGS